MEKYRPAVIEMCRAFEGGLASFIKNLVPSDEIGKSSEQGHTEEAEQVEKYKRKRVARRPIEALKKRKQQGGHQDPGKEQVKVAVTNDRANDVVKGTEKRINDVADLTSPVAEIGGQLGEQPKPTASLDVNPATEVAVKGAVKGTVEETDPNVVVKGTEKGINIDSVTDLPSPVTENSGHLDGEQPGEQPKQTGSLDITHAADVTPDALKLLHIYGTGSKTLSTEDNAHLLVEKGLDREQPGVHVHFEEHKNEDPQQRKSIGAEILIKVTPPGKKSKFVSSKVRGEAGKSIEAHTSLLGKEKKLKPCSPVNRRPITRSMSPKKPGSLVTKVAATTSRLSRFGKEQAKENDSNGNEPGETTGTCAMNRNLKAQFDNAVGTIEIVTQRHRRELIEYSPSFDLGFEEELTIMS
jgi:hypothetical protein